MCFSKYALSTSRCRYYLLPTVIFSETLLIRTSLDSLSRNPSKRTIYFGKLASLLRVMMRSSLLGTMVITDDLPYISRFAHADACPKQLVFCLGEFTQIVVLHQIHVRPSSTLCLHAPTRYVLLPTYFVCTQAFILISLLPSPQGYTSTPCPVA
jgi:hypothetical protein